MAGRYHKNFEKNDKPSQLTGLWIDRLLQRYLAFMDSDYRLSQWAPRSITPGARTYGPYENVWKLSEVFDGRQFFMWDQIEKNTYLRTHARYAWNVFKGPPLPPFIANNVIARSAEAVRRIRARGGDVIFIRPPSAPELRVNREQATAEIDRVGRVAKAAQAKGIHADDLPRAQNLVIPEWSHLNRACATVFTDAYVRRLVELTPRLKLRADAPRPLSRADCVPQNIASL